MDAAQGTFRKQWICNEEERRPRSELGSVWLVTGVGRMRVWFIKVHGGRHFDEPQGRGKTTPHWPRQGEKPAGGHEEV